MSPLEQLLTQILEEQRQQKQLLTQILAKLQILNAFLESLFHLHLHIETQDEHRGSDGTIHNHVSIETEIQP